MSELLAQIIDQIAAGLGTYSFVVRGALAVILVSLICGGVGSLVVGNRMAFFSDALAHCAFAGVSLGILLSFVIRGRQSESALEWLAPVFMVGFGALIGVSIAFVRERTALASDTVIGVFFAGAIGIGALLFPALKTITNRDAEVFFFGNLNILHEPELLRLVVLAVLTVVVLVLRYNQLLFASFNPSLARSRRIPLKLYNYLFIVLLALIVNLCLQAVGVLLINAMLIVPAATANNISRNMRQMFWWTIGLSLLTGLSGHWISTFAEIPLQAGAKFYPGASGCIVVLSVLAFGVSMALSRVIRGRQSR
jgi:zinc transport system permease protein